LFESVKQVCGKGWKEKIYERMERQRGVDAEKDSSENRELASGEG
jgi:hypothetical protein